MLVPAKSEKVTLLGLGVTVTVATTVGVGVGAGVATEQSAPVGVTFVTTKADS